MSAVYQCLKTTTRHIYCSAKKVRSKEQGKSWVRLCMQCFGIPREDVQSVYTSKAPPKGATMWWPPSPEHAAELEEDRDLELTQQ